MPEHPTLPPESSLTPAELSHEVASYIDTLKVQIHALCATYDIPITPSIPDTIQAFADKARAREIPPKALTHLLALFTAWSAAAETNRIPTSERESDPVTATVLSSHDSADSFEADREITLDLREVLNASLAFLDAKQPPDVITPPSWSQSLRDAFPNGIAITPDQRATIERAIERGFTRAILLPSADRQGITTIERTIPDPKDPTKHITERVASDPDRLTHVTDHLLHTCANADGTHAVPGLKAGDADGQYGTPYVHSESLKHPALRDGAPARTRPYLLLYRPDGILSETKGHTFPECEAILTERSRDWNLPTLTGFTNIEYLLVQRKEVEIRAPLTPAVRIQQHGDQRVHGFDAYDVDDARSRWALNLDSRVPGGCGHGRWVPGSLRLRLDWSGASDRASGFGARPAVVVEL